MRELLVDRGGLALQHEDIEILRERTEGWPAAVYLAALWLRGVDDQRRAVRDFGGDHRFVAQYLSQEVLTALDPEERSFLLRAAASEGSPLTCAMRCCVAPTRRRCSLSSSNRTCSSYHSSGGSGFASTRCSGSSPARCWSRVTPAPNRSDPSPRGAVAALTRVARRSYRARRRGGGSGSRRRAAQRISSRPDPKREVSHAPALGAHAP